MNNYLLCGQKLAHVLYTCVAHGVYPDLLKITKVIPLYKKGPRELPDNHRWINLVSCINKIFDKLIYKSLGAIVLLNTKCHTVWFYSKPLNRCSCAHHTPAMNTRDSRTLPNTSLELEFFSYSGASSLFLSRHLNTLCQFYEHNSTNWNYW